MRSGENLDFNGRLLSLAKHSVSVNEDLVLSAGLTESQLGRLNVSAVVTLEV